jgi:MscS family membrane protein
MNLIISSILLVLAIAGYAYGAIAIPVPAEYQTFINQGTIVILGFLSILVASSLTTTLFDKFFAKLMKGNGLARKVFPLLRYVIKIVLWLVGIFFILTLLKINVSALLTGAGVSGIAIAFAGKDYAANLIGSINLIFSKSFKIGDIIRVKGYEGTVEEVTLTLTRLIDKNGAVIFMPNKLIVSETIENLTEKRFERIELMIEIPVGQDQQSPEGVIDGIENEISRLTKKFDIQKSSVGIEKITTLATIVAVRLQLEVGVDIESIKKALYQSVRKTKM